ncbi:MAG: hypothetical protein ACK52U_13255 [Synechococcaceae cyanobacterium]|jgi:hypothetical protein
MKVIAVMLGETGIDNKPRPYRRAKAPPFRFHEAECLATEEAETEVASPELG